MVVGFAGPIGAGKTTGATYLRDAHGFSYVRYSQVLAEWQRTDPGAKTLLQANGWEVMTSGLQAELNRQVIACIAPDSDTAIDGMRHPVDEASLREQFHSGFLMVYVDAPEELRWQRTSSMGRFKLRTEFDAADQHQVEQPLRGLRSLANVVIENAGPISSYLEVVDAALRRARVAGNGGQK